MNIATEYCSMLLLIILGIFYLFDKTEQNKRKNVFSMLIITTFFHSFMNIIRFSTQNIIIGYITTLLFHATYTIVFLLIFMYCLLLTPHYSENLKKTKNIFVAFNALVTLIILTSPFTKFVYYLEDGQIKQGNLYTISFITGYIGVVFVSLFIINSKNISRHAIKTMVVACSIAVLCSVAEAVLKNVVISGFGITCAIFIFYNEFYIFGFSSQYGIRSKYRLKRDFNKYKKYSVINLKINNLEYLEKKAGKNKYIYLFDIFKDSEKDKIKPKIYRYKDDSFVFLTKIEDRQAVVDFVQKLNESLEKLAYKLDISIDYKIKYCIYPNVLDNLSYLNEIKQNKRIKEIDDKDIEMMHRKEKLFWQLKDIFNKNDLNDERVRIFFQPILNSKENKFLSAEALSRLYIEGLGGYIYPDEFIPVLEQYHFIHKYSLIILNKVCNIIKELENTKTEFEGISVNFSMQEFIEPNFESDVLNIVKRNGVSPERIHIEITESEKGDNIDVVKKKMEFLKQFGFKFYLDDFGTGYSNFTGIMELPFDTIKFDKSLVSKSLNDKIAFGVTSKLVELFNLYDFNTLFEGIEDDKHEKMSNDLNVLLLQGFKFSKPIPVCDALRFFGNSPEDLKL